MLKVSHALAAMILVTGCGAPPAAPASGHPTATALAAAPSIVASAAAGAASIAPAPSVTAKPLALLGPLPTGALDQATAARLQHVLDGLVEVGNGDAIAAVITQDGVWAGAAGIDGPKQRHAQPTDEFNIASVSKTILATFVLRLVEQGKIDLDAPLATYLKGFKVNANVASVRQALAMQSGLGDTPSAALDEAFAHCEHAWTRDEVLATIPAPFAPPGTTYHYSNPTYKLVGYAAEAAAGKPLAEALRAGVFDPVHADRMSLQGAGEATPKPWALPLDGHNDNLAVDAYGTGGTLPCLAVSSLSLAASGIASDAPSLARWGWELFAGRFVGAPSLATMTTVDAQGHGLGIDRISDFGPVLAYGHAGSQSGYSALMTILPERQVVVAFFINDGQADPYGPTGVLIDAIGGS